MPAIDTRSHGTSFHRAADRRQDALAHAAHRFARFGKFICDRYHETALRWCERYYAPLPHKELAFLSLDTDEGGDYLIDMGFAMRFAEESRKRIRDRALSAVEETFGAFTVGIDIETHHNFAAREKHMGKDVVVHRKGAVKTGEGLVTIPGSMQTGSYIAEGIANRLALDTCSHGAGRKLCRGAVRRANMASISAPRWRPRA